MQRIDIAATFVTKSKPPPEVSPRWTATAPRANTTAASSCQYTFFFRIPCRICTASTAREITITLPRMITMATMTLMGSVYMSVVVGMTTAVQTPEGTMYASSPGTRRPSSVVGWFDSSRYQPSATATARQITVPPSVLYARKCMSFMPEPRNHFTATPVIT